MAESETARRRGSVPDEVTEARQKLEEYAEEQGETVGQAAEDVMSQWTQSWCDATPSFVSEGLSACRVAGEIRQLARESDRVDSSAELVNRALKEG